MISAKEFFKQFKENLYIPTAMYKDKLYSEIYKNCKEYTELINKFVVCKILENNNLKWQNEYYNIDLIGWKSTKNDNFEQPYSDAKLNYHSWKLEFAFEHENDSQDWSYEVIKLLYIDCPLRVVVGYNNATKRDDPVCGDKAKLDLLSSTILQNIGVQINNDFLIILGNSGSTFDPSVGLENFFGYRAYLYNNDSNSFQPID